MTPADAERGAVRLAEIRLAGEYLDWRETTGLEPAHDVEKRLARWEWESRAWGTLLPCCYDEDQ